jgi:nucleoside-diphosphate-sugar epimerase
VNVLVTGASGFIGRALVLRLAARGDRVLCLVRDPARSPWMRAVPGVEPVVGDLADAGLLRDLAARAALVHHVAGLTHARRREEFLAVNAEAVGRLAAAAAAAPSPPKLVLVSSLAVAGPRTAARPAREEDPPAPTTPYGESKLRGEELLRREGAGLRWTIVRPPWVYGPGDRATLALFRMADRGLVPLPRGGCMEMSIVHVDDLVEVLLLAGDCACADGRTYYACDGAVHTVAELGRLLVAAAGRGCTVPVPGFLLRLAGLAGEAAAALARRPARVGWHKACEGLEDGWVCSDERARAELGYRSRVDLEAGVASTFAWYRQEGWL